MSLWDGVRHRLRAVGDVRFGTIDSVAKPDAYVPYYQSPRPGAMVFIRTKGDPAALATAARRTVQQLGPNLAVYDVRTLTSRVGDATAQAHFRAILLSMFAGAALLLATVGIYGVISYAVAQRTREIGIRFALGAKKLDVLRLVVAHGLALGAVGLVFGAGAALLTTRGLDSLLFDVTPSDPLTLVAVGVVLGGSAVVASLIPAARAATLEPVDALRN